MDALSPSVIGWVFALFCGFALAVGIWMIIGLHFSGPEAKKHLASRVLDDTILFGIWVLGLVGSIGLLLGKDWAATLMQFFCWTLIALVVLSARGRWRAAPRPKGTIAVSIALFAGPIIVFCVASILSLRSPPGG